MRAALNALEAGATSVNLSPNGCIRIEQQVLNGEVQSRTFTIAGTVISSRERVGNQWREQRDSDHDGFFEWRSITTYGATADAFETVETEYSATTQQPTERTTITPDGDNVHVVVETRNSAGTWDVVSDYRTPRVQGATMGTAQGTPGSGLAPFLQGTCEANPCSPEDIKSRMEEGTNLALQCLSNFGDRGVAIYEAAFNTLSRRMTVRCAPIPGDTQANVGGWENPNGGLIVTVDPSKYCNLDEGQRAWLLFHEILHAALRRGHDPALDSLPQEQRKQLDRIYGCIALCYENQNNPTQCMCAQCLGTVTCDPICATYSQDCGATCPCPARFGQYYTTCSECLSECPSGLSCFGWTFCDPVGHSPVCPPVTCP